MNASDTVTLTLTPAETDYVVAVLAQRPYIESAALIEKIGAARVPVRKAPDDRG